MYVEKFEGDSLSQALKKIKLKLGPDAIILKTVTNKGLIGALKGRKIEITAAISEESYRKKMSVDKALGDKVKDDFYQAPSSYIAQEIDKYDKENKGQSYGKLALNQTLKKVENAEKLDDFLNHHKKIVSTVVNEKTPAGKDDFDQPEITQNDSRIDHLERKIFELSKILEKIQNTEPKGVARVRHVLHGLGLKDPFVSKIIKKAIFELPPQSLESEEEEVMDIVLREISESINIEMPLLSNIDKQGPVITFLLSGSSMGQTSTSYKLSSLKDDSVLIRFANGKTPYSLTSKVFNINEKKVLSLAEVVSESRNSVNNGQNVFIDYKNDIAQEDDVKSFIRGLRRSFENIEVLTCVSSISSGAYNRKCLNLYGDLLDGVVLTKLDLCLDFGNLLDIHIDFNNLPLKFFTTGSVIPDDIESATRERLLNGIFKFE